MSDSLKTEHPVAQMETVVALLPPKVRDKARAVLLQGDAKSVQLLTRVISKERTKRRSRAKATALPGSLLLIGSLLTAARPHLFGGYTAALGLSGLGLLALSALTRMPSRLQKAAQEALVQSEDPEGIGALLERLPLRSPVLRAQVRADLIQALPQITADSFRKLTPKQRGYLYGTLSYEQRDRDMDLRLSVLAALEEVGDASCLGVVYQLTTGEAVTDTAVAVREAARNCLDCLFARLDFGPLEALPQHLLSISAEIREEKTDFQAYATSLLSLRQLLPQLTPANYRSILSANQRTQLYALPMLYAVSNNGKYQFRRRDLHLEIVRTADRLRDTRALEGLLSFVCSTMAAADEELYAALCRVNSALEALADQKSVGGRAQNSQEGGDEK